jgi:hypothetical protein
MLPWVLYQSVKYQNHGVTGAVLITASNRFTWSLAGSAGR